MQVSNSIFALRDILLDARALSESLKKELTEAKARESKALGELQIIKEDHRAWRERGDEELRALDAKLSEVMARILPTEEKLKETMLKLEHTENRADSAEAAARDAAEGLALAEKEAREASNKLAVAEREAQEARELMAVAQEETARAKAQAREEVATAQVQAQEAVQKYKDSPDFAAECQEAVMDAFIQGFELSKKKLSRRFKLGDLDDVRPGDTSGNPDAEGEGVAEESAVAEESIGGATIVVEPLLEPAAEDEGAEK